VRAGVLCQLRTLSDADLSICNRFPFFLNDGSKRHQWRRLHLALCQCQRIKLGRVLFGLKAESGEDILDTVCIEVLLFELGLVLELSLLNVEKHFDRGPDAAVGVLDEILQFFRAELQLKLGVLGQDCFDELSIVLVIPVQ
jgi:hypothetical protein